MPDPAETMRLRYLYRDLVIRRRIRLPLAGAMKIVGPDCAYHLYGSNEHDDGTSTSRGGESNRTRTDHPEPAGR